MFEFMTIRELFEIITKGSQMEIDSMEYVQLQGWIRTNRCSGKLGFIELNDGTYFRNAQLVYKSELKNFEEVEKYPTGAA
ncbi:MAG: asparagine--tRNA ligase, partial [Longicatena sp.]|nr:asparagine--tRNA ligase [Longicatena sp.]